MKVKDLGEFGVIELLADMAAEGRSGPDNAGPFGIKLLVDVGDDAAAWQCGRGVELYTTDSAVEGVHFTRDSTPWYDLGWKIMAANVSDIAAMGGLPLYALVTLGLPRETEVEDLKSLYRGMLDLGGRHGVAIVGGDMVRSPVVFVTVGLTGVCEGDLMLRAAARPGDLVAVTGYVGSSAGGLKVMMKDLPVRGEAAEYLKAAHRRPEPCVAQGQLLSRQGIRAAMDVSDGLLDDLSKLCYASGVAARVNVDHIPISPILKEVFPETYLDMALGGGEDYQLLFTAPEELMERVVPMLPPSAAVLGEITAGESGRVTLAGPSSGERVVSRQSGWDHFR